MSVHVIDPEYHWKEAASQEGVDYDAVQKSFMDQAYGVVANKAKILFQDPFRLGFEIVHRNEKATKMVGIFAFRVNRELLYAPVFFVNGEIKSADMLYRSDVKRFVPLTEDWCAFLVRGTSEEGGQVVDKNRIRQADAYMDRLAYPQRVKYASHEPPITFQTLMTHCADATPLEPILPRLIDENGPDTLEKLASVIEGSDIAARYLVENYSEEQLTNVTTWMAKEATAADPEANQIIINLDPRLTKSASAREGLMTRGYELVDNRPEGATNTVVEEIGDGFVQELASTCVADVLMDGGGTERVLLLAQDHSLVDFDNDPVDHGDSYEKTQKPDIAYFPDTKECLKIGYNQPVFGSEPLLDDVKNVASVNAPGLKVGKCYIILDIDRLMCSKPIVIEDKHEDGESTIIHIAERWGSKTKLVYAPDRGKSEGTYISDNVYFLEVDADIDRHDTGEVRAIDPKCSRALMNSAGIDQWIRTAGGTTSSNDIKVSANKDRGTFDITHSVAGGVVKTARDLGMLEAHLAVAEDFCLTCDKAGEILNKAADKDVSYRVYDTMSKSGYVTRQEGMQDWVTGFDPELQVKLDSPQRQVLGTYTPRRNDQQPRYGDTFQRQPAENRIGMEDGLPKDALMSHSPEELAQLSEKYDMPHIFDHGCLEQMSTTSFSVIEQIKKYIPDLESGVDRLFRILFLLRYRPADFEEAYGKDALLEMEQELSELAGASGDNLLRMLQRFDGDQYSTQEN